jgi:hypothetical protein
MNTALPVRLLSRLVGWLCDVRESEAHSSKNDEMRARAEAWLAGHVRRDLAASVDTATQLARDVVALTASPVVLRGERHG